MCQIGNFLSRKVPGFDGKSLKDRNPTETLETAFASQPDKLLVFLETLNMLTIGVGKVCQQTTFGELAQLVTTSTSEFVAETTGHSPEAVVRLYKKHNLGSFASTN